MRLLDYLKGHSLPNENMNDAMKINFLNENWEYIILEDLELLVKIRKEEEFNLFEMR